MTRSQAADPFAPTATRAVSSAPPPTRRAHNSRHSSNLPPEIEAPRYRGTGLIVAGSLIGAGAMIAKISATSQVYPPTDYPTDQEWSAPTRTMAAGLLGITPSFAISLGLVGGGLGRRGHWTAHRDWQRGHINPRKYVVREVVGWSLFATGMLAYIGSRVLVSSCPAGPSTQTTEADLHRERCMLNVLEGGYYTSLALAGVGIGLAPFASGYRNRSLRLQDVSITSLGTKGARGLAISGRF